MKEIVVLSGKGGTGKTVMTGALAAMAHRKVLADCDVDGSNLPLILGPEITERYEFRGGYKAWIDPERCQTCELCREHCRFDAIKEDFRVDDAACEGCGLCRRLCPEDAVQMRQSLSGEWFVSDTLYGPLVHARLYPGEENCGKLVTAVKTRAREIALESGRDWILVDGSPGIGCPVIASMTGAWAALIVTEPTLAGWHDAERVIDTALHFGVPPAVVINKWDLNPEMSGEIAGCCEDRGLPLLGRLGFDPDIVKAVMNGRTVMEFVTGETRRVLIEIWKQLQALTA